MSKSQPVMIVDDDLDLGELLAELIASVGYPVMRARNGAEALEQLRQATTPPSLILLDLMMPVMDGWTFREQQLGDAALRNIPVVVLTADARAHDKPRTKALHFNRVLTKPIEFERLLEMVQQHAS